MISFLVSNKFMNLSFDSFCMDPLSICDHSSCFPYLCILDQDFDQSGPFTKDFFTIENPEEQVPPNQHKMVEIKLEPQNESKANSIDELLMPFRPDPFEDQEQTQKISDSHRKNAEHDEGYEDGSQNLNQFEKKQYSIQRGRYNILNEYQKRKIVEETKVRTIIEVARKYGVSVNNICRWRKRCDRRSGAGRKVNDQEMEITLLEWIRKNSANLTRKIIQKKAKELSKNDEFKASKGWFERFFKRNKLSSEFKHLGVRQNRKERSTRVKQEHLVKIQEQFESSMHNQEDNRVFIKEQYHQIDEEKPRDPLFE